MGKPSICENVIPIMFEESGLSQSERYTVAISSIESDFATEDGSIVKGFIGIVRGIAVDHAYGSPPEILTGIVDDALRFEAVAGWQSEAGRDGFVFRFHTVALEPGEHSVRVVASSRDASSSAQSATLTFTLLPTENVIPHPTYAQTWACAMLDWADRPPSSVAIIPEQRRIRRGEVVHVRGWAIDTSTADSAGDAFLMLDGTHAIHLECRQWRPDVSAAFGFANAAYCGFVGSIATEMLEPGLHLGACFILAKNFTQTYRTDAVLMFEIVDTSVVP